MWCYCKSTHRFSCAPRVDRVRTGGGERIQGRGRRRPGHAAPESAWRDVTTRIVLTIGPAHRIRYAAAGPAAGRRVDYTAAQARGSDLVFTSLSAVPFGSPDLRRTLPSSFSSSDTNSRLAAMSSMHRENTSWFCIVSLLDRLTDVGVVADKLRQARPRRELCSDGCHRYADKRHAAGQGAGFSLRKALPTGRACPARHGNCSYSAMREIPRPAPLAGSVAA